MTSNNELLVDFEPLSLATIDLEPEQIQQAIQLSSQIPNLEQQWQSYLNLLALSSFEQWLSQRHPQLHLNKESSTILQPQYANVLQAVCRLQVGEFKLCLLTTGTMMDDRIILPRAVIDLPEYSAHFYVVIAVQEEQEQASVEGFISYEQLKEYQQTARLRPEADWTYEVPWTCFDCELENLLLYLRCLEPTSITLPTTPSTPLASVTELQAKLRQLIPQLSDPSKCCLWQLLTWAEGASLLSHPLLLDWLYRLQREAPSTQNEPSFTHQLSQIIERLTQSVVNVGQWLNAPLDEFSQNLSWLLFPPLAQTSFRSAATFEGIMQPLKERGMSIPDTAWGAYRDLSLGNIDLRLSAVTWLLSTQETENQWSLLLILGRQSGEALPAGLKLQVSDLTEILVERVVVNVNTEETYLYTRVVGSFGEEFNVTITLGNNPVLRLPPFTFNPYS